MIRGQTGSGVYLENTGAGDTSRRRTIVGIGLGVVLIVIGAALIWALDVDIAFIEDYTLGWILLLAGVLTIALSLVISAQRSRHRTTHVEERRTDGTV